MVFIYNNLLPPTHEITYIAEYLLGTYDEYGAYHDHSWTVLQCVDYSCKLSERNSNGNCTIKLQSEYLQSDYVGRGNYAKKGLAQFTPLPI